MQTHDRQLRSNIVARPAHSDFKKLALVDKINLF
jgi:hypothetical protein